MTPERRAVIISWCRKAESDLAYAELGLRSGEVYRAGGVYHCQQSAEKAIKALHCLFGIIPPKIHDLVRLIELLQPSCDMQEFLEEAEFLTPLATEFRYPGDTEEPSEEDAQRALIYAKRICGKAQVLIKEKINLS